MDGSDVTLAEALQYIAMGWQVFPCHTIIEGKCSCGKIDCESNAKHPRNRNGLKGATDDERRVRSIFATPANIGVRTGSHSGILVVDVDPRHAGNNALLEIEAVYGELPQTVEAHTGGGGRHLYFRLPIDRKVGSKNNWRQGIDIKADGGYVIAPPSIHVSGGRYKWRPGRGPGEVKLADAPDWLLSSLSKIGKTGPVGSPTRPICGSPALLDRARKYVAKAKAVDEGARDDSAFRLAGQVAAFENEHGERLSKAEIVEVLRPWNATNNPPLSDPTLQKCVASALRNGMPRKAKTPTSKAATKSTDSPSDSGAAPPSQSTLTVQLIEDVELFHDGDREPFARYPVGDGSVGHWEVAHIRNRNFCNWLSRRFYMLSGKTLSAQSMQDALRVIEAKAIFDGDSREVFIRVADKDGTIYLDLCNELWQVIEIDAAGWRIVDESPVMFRRAKSMQPMVRPDQPGDIQAFRRFANVTDDDWTLLLGFLVGAMCPTGPYPVLAVYGEHGSAKSSLCRFIRKILDPNRSPLRADHRSPHDLMIGASNGWIVALDNLSNIQPWLSDCLCRLSTGGGFSTRKLYENDEEMIFDAKRPVILNCIEEAVVRADLLDRSLVLNLPRIDPTSRIPERQLEREFDRELPRILGGLLTAVSAAIRNERSVKLSSHPRMADFAIRVVAAESALGLKTGEFLGAYEKNRDDGNETAIEASPIGRALWELVDRVGFWSGTATELLRQLEGEVDSKTTGMKSWPATPRVLSGAVKRLAPNLRDLGIEVEFERKGHKGARTIMLSRRPENSENSSSAASAEPGDPSMHPFCASSVDEVADDDSVQHLLSLSPSSASKETLAGEFDFSADADDADAKFQATALGNGWGEV